MSPEVYAIIIAPIATLFIGVALNRFIEDRPRLISYISNTFGISINLPESDGKTYRVHSHSITIRNTGRKAAKNVRIGHNVLPNFQVLPAGMQYEVLTTPDGKKEIVFSTLVPKEQVIVNYLYYPPLTVVNINTIEKFDDGFAKRLPVLITRQYSKRFNFFAATMFLIGIATVIYWIIRLLLLR
jgi:hypothetical protein